MSTLRANELKKLDDTNWVGTNPTQVPTNDMLSVRLGADGYKTEDELNDAGFAQSVDSVSALQLATFPASLERLWLSGYYGVGTAGGGPLYRDSGDTTTADNGGTVFVDADGVRWKRSFDGAVSVTWFGAKGDDATNDTAALQAAIDTGRGVFLPSGTYIVDELVINTSNISITGENFRSTVLKAISSKTTGYILNIATTEYVSGCEFKSFSIEGLEDCNTASPANTIGGIAFGSSITNAFTRNNFEHVYVSKVHTAFRGTYAWTNTFRNISASQCFIGLHTTAQVNNCDFVKFIAVNCRFQMDLNSTEALSFISPLFQNTSLGAGEGIGIDLFQTMVYMSEPYFEGMAPDGLIKLGNTSEDITAPSNLIISGGELNSPSGFILKLSRYATFHINNLRQPTDVEVVVGGEAANDTASTDPRRGSGASCRLYKLTADASEASKLLYSLPTDNSVPLIRAGGGGSLTTKTTPDNYLSVLVSENFRGIVIPYTLVENEVYTFVCRLRSESGSIIQAPRNCSITDAYPGLSGEFETRYFTIKADATGSAGLLISTANTEMQIQQLDIYKGCVVGTDNGFRQKTPGFNTSAPTTGTWKVNDRVYAKSPAASGSIGWVCTEAGTPGTWKAFGTIEA